MIETRKSLIIWKIGYCYYNVKDCNTLKLSNENFLFFEMK